MRRAWTRLLVWALLSGMGGAAPMTAYADPQFGGAFRDFALGWHVYWFEQDFAPAGNDQISSLKVARGFVLLACEHERFGRCRVFPAGAYSQLEPQWDNIFSYLEVRRVGERFLTLPEVVSKMERRLVQLASQAVHIQRFGGMRITLERCARIPPASVQVTCSFDFHQTTGRTGFVLTVEGSRLELFDRSFPATALEVRASGRRSQVPWVFPSRTHTPVRFHFAVPREVHAVQRLRYNVGDTVFVLDNVALVGESSSDRAVPAGQTPRTQSR